MKLSISLVPVIVVVIFMMTMVGLRVDTFDQFVSEQGYPVYVATKSSEVLLQPSQVEFEAKAPVTAGSNTPTIMASSTVGYGPGTSDSLAAFPGCRGAGCGALQQYRSNGIRLCRVSNLDGSGAGSFQACMAIVEADSNTANKPLDIVVFDTAGAIRWSPTCSNNACNIWRGVYVAGQSAPGPIVFWGNVMRSQTGSEDIVFRSVAFRAMGQNVWAGGGYRRVFDHVSLSHAGERAARAYGDTTGGDQDSAHVARYQTWRNMLFSYKTCQRDRAANISEPPTFILLNGSPRNISPVSHITFNRNLVMLSRTGVCSGPYRGPATNSDSIWIHQNFTYAQYPGDQWSYGTSGATADWTYNNWLQGVSRPKTSASYWPLAFDTLGACQCWNGSSSYDCPPENCTNSYYVQKNHTHHITGYLGGGSNYADTLLSQDSLWRGSSRVISTHDPGSAGSYVDSSSVTLTYRRDDPLEWAIPFPMDTFEMSAARFDAMLDSVGAGWKVDSLGAVYMLPDTVDRRAVASVRDTTLYSNPGDVNRDSFAVDYWPDWVDDVHAKCRDDDNDAMCDAWEILASGSTSLSPTTVQASGYYAIELAYAGGITNIDTVFGVQGVSNDLPAYQGAVGWGSSAFQGCVKDTVIIEKITSLSGDTSVVGTLANTLKHKQHGDTLTIVTWAIGGWSAPISWPGVGGWEGTLECTYLAMQTAPGGGVGYHRFVILQPIDDSHDFVIRGGTFAGDPRGTANEGGMFYIQDAQNFIVSEMDLYWGEGEKLMKLVPVSDYDTIANATVERVAFFLTRDLEATSFQINEALVTEPHLRRVSLYKNLFHTCGWRCPMIGTKILGPPLQDPDSVPRVRMVGTFWYNSGKQAHVEVRGRMVDVLDGYVKTGPFSTDGTPDHSWAVVLHPDNDRDPDTASSVYVDRLIGAHNRDTLASGVEMWTDGGGKQEVACRRDMCEAAGGGDPRDSLGADIKRDTPIPTDSLSDFPMPRVNPFDLADELLGTATDSGQVGAYRRIQCDGTWAMRSDSAHAALLADARDSTGLSAAVDSTWIAARYPWTKATGSACNDTDGDGLPNEFENLCGGSTTALSPSADLSGNGYSAAEEYVNGTNGIRALAWNDNSIGEDGFRIYRDTGTGFVELITVGANVTEYTDENSYIGYRYKVVAYQGVDESADSNIITSTCN